MSANAGEFRVSCFLMVDNTPYMKMYHSLMATGGSDYPGSHFSGIVKLQAGQKVWLKNFDTSVVNGVENAPGTEMFTWFSGYLLFADN